MDNGYGSLRHLLTPLLGSIFGPTVGGSLANPLNVKPGEKVGSANLFAQFPYLLPNLVSATFFAISIATGILFLEETLETAKGRRDYGLILGKKLSTAVRYYVVRFEEILHIRTKPDQSHTNGETDPLLKRPTSSDDSEANVARESKPRVAPPSWREVLNRQAVINLVVYTLLAMHAMAFDQLLPVFLQHDPIDAPHGTPYEAPLKFAGGFGLNHFQIGLLSTGYGIFGLPVQFLVFPPLARKYGVLFWLKVVSIVFIFVYLATPFAVSKKSIEKSVLFTLRKVLTSTCRF